MKNAFCIRRELGGCQSHHVSQFCCREISQSWSSASWALKGVPGMGFPADKQQKEPSVLRHFFIVLYLGLDKKRWVVLCICL